MRSLVWKPGVTKLGSRAYRCLSWEQAKKGWWPFSYRLLEELAEQYRESDEPLLERLYASLEAGNGVYKITKRGRFERLNRLLVKNLSLMPEATLWDVHDIAVSSAITSVELYECLSQLHSVRFEASDFYHRIWLVVHQGWTIAFDEGNHPVQMAGYGMVMSIHRGEPWHLILNKTAQSYVKRFVIPVAKAKLLQHREQRSFDYSETVKPVSLFHPIAHRLTQRSPGFVLCQRNGLQPLARKSHLIRVLNFLTPRHLARDQIVEGWKSLSSSLHPGGFLIVGRTRDESDGALLVSAYQMEMGMMVKRWEMDEPWECEKGYELPNLQC